MKTVIAIVALSIFACTLGLTQETTQRTITVLGTAEVKAVADRASFEFSVKGVGSTLTKAVQDASKKTREITQLLLSIGVKTKDISTEQFFTGENFGDKAFFSSNRDFQATLRTHVSVDSIPLLDTIFTSISDLQIDQLSGPANLSFSLRDDADLRIRTRIAAAKNAHDRADSIATALGAQIGSVLKIEEVQPTRTSLETNRSNYPNPFNSVTTASVYERGGASGQFIDQSSDFYGTTIIATSEIKVVFLLK